MVIVGKRATTVPGADATSAGNRETVHRRMGHGAIQHLLLVLVGQIPVFVRREADQEAARVGLNRRPHRGKVPVRRRSPLELKDGKVELLVPVDDPYGPRLLSVGSHDLKRFVRDVLRLEVRRHDHAADVRFRFEHVVARHEKSKLAIDKRSALSHQHVRAAAALIYAMPANSVREVTISRDVAPFNASANLLGRE